MITCIDRSPSETPCVRDALASIAICVKSLSFHGLAHFRRQMNAEERLDTKRFR
jgi:hypothetical protein